MATKRLLMRQLREILRLKHERGLPNRAIARACSVGVGTVSDYLNRARRSGVGWPLPDDLDDRELERKLFPSMSVVEGRVLPELAHVHEELRRPGVTLQLLWVEYFEKHPQGYRYSQFCDLYRRWARLLSPPMRQVHRAGEKIFADFSGKRPSIVDRRTGEATEVELFVGVLGASSYTYAEAVPSQRIEHWIGVHVRMFEFLGGCAAILVPDNLKSGITVPCRYEPVVNRTFGELAAHYGATVIPARSYRPRDKAKVEVGVQVAQRWILARLRNRAFFSLAELNEAIRELLAQLNSRPMKHLGASRRELFERLDQPALKPLPTSRFELAEWKTCRVNIDYHIEVDHNYYSVPYQLVGEQVEARATVTTVEVFFKSRRIASHARRSGRGRYTTLPEHMPASHRAHAEWTPSRLISWAEKTGPATGRLVAGILDRYPHPEQGYRSCLGIMRLARRHGEMRVDAACGRAEALGSYSYQTVKNILGARVEGLPFEEPASGTATLPVHDNIRGAEYYHKEEKC
jgi:transposase